MTYDQLTTEGARQLTELDGQLNWPSLQTRSDMSFAVSKVSVSIKDARIHAALNRYKFSKIKYLGKEGSTTISKSKGYRKM